MKNFKEKVAVVTGAASGIGKAIAQRCVQEEMKVVLADIEEKVYSLDPADVERKITPKTKAILPIHYGGSPCLIRELREIADAHNLLLIEDAAEAFGAAIGEEKVGTFGHSSVFSFCQNKIITTGEGGMVVSNSKKFIERTRDLREYDKSVDYKIRYNYKMTDIQAAIGLAQLDQLETFIQRRRSIAQNYYTAFSSLGVQLPTKDPEHIYYRYVVDLGIDTTPWQRSLSAKGVACAPPVHPPLYIYLRESGFPKTETAWKQCISIPIYPSLSDEEMDRVIKSFIQTRQEVEND